MKVEFSCTVVTEERLLVLRFGLEACPLIDKFLIDFHFSSKLISEIIQLIEVFLDILDDHLMNKLQNLLVLPCHGREHKVCEYSHVWNYVWIVVLLIVVVSHIHLI